MNKVIPITESRDGLRFQVRVAPRASRTAVIGTMGNALKIALQAPPVEGRANAALIEFLSAWLRIPRSSIEIAAGTTGRNKTILVRGRTIEEIEKRIAEAAAETKRG